MKPKAPESQPGIRSCEAVSDLDWYHRYQYRAITTTIDGRHLYDDIVPRDLVAHLPMAPTSESDLARHRQDFGAFEVCKGSDPTHPELNAYYVAFEKRLKRGGRDQPYPRIPTCSKFQVLRRALLKPGPSGKDVPVSIHQMGRLTPDMVDPAPSDRARVERHLRREGAVGLCQMQISNAPERHALFGAFNRDPLGRLELMPQGSDPASIDRSLKAIRNALPKAFRRCGSDADYHRMLRIHEEAGQALRRRVERRTDPALLPVAREIAEKVAAAARMNALSEEQRAFLEETIVMGLAHEALTEEDAIAIVSDLSERARQEERTLYGFATVVAVRVAQYLDERFGRTGQRIGPDMPKFAAWVEAAIRKGELSVRLKTVSDSLFTPGALAYHDSTSRSIAFPAIGRGTSPSLLFEPLLHECWHAFDEHRGRITTNERWAVEWTAYTVGARASSLLLYDDLFGVENDAGTLLGISREAMRSLATSTLGDLACLGAPAWAIQRQRDLVDATFVRSLQYYGAVQMEILGAALQGAFDEFWDYFATTNLDITETVVFRSALLQEGFRREAAGKGRATTAHAANRVPQGDPKKALGFHNTKPGTKERGLAAWRYLTAFGASVAPLYFTDRKRYWEAMRRYVAEVSPSMRGALACAPYLGSTRIDDALLDDVED